MSPLQQLKQLLDYLNWQPGLVTGAQSVQQLKQLHRLSTGHEARLPIQNGMRSIP